MAAILEPPSADYSDFKIDPKELSGEMPIKGSPEWKATKVTPPANAPGTPARPPEPKASDGQTPPAQRSADPASGNSPVAESAPGQQPANAPAAAPAPGADAEDDYQTAPMPRDAKGWDKWKSKRAAKEAAYKAEVEKANAKLKELEEQVKAAAETPTADPLTIQENERLKAELKAYQDKVDELDVRHDPRFVIG